MLSVEQVVRLLQEQIKVPSPEETPLALAADLVLAAPVTLDADAPPFDRVMLDGFAVQAAHALAGSQLQILGHQQAGAPQNVEVLAGTAMGVNTGSPLPPGADAVVMLEQTACVTSQPKQVLILQATRPGGGVALRGSDARAGQVVLQAGTRLNASALAVAAACGAAMPLVYLRPRVAVLTTGDELVAVEVPPGPGQIRNSNALMLAAQARRAGAEVVFVGHAADRREILRPQIQQALGQADVVLISGGMAAGSCDLVTPMLLELGLQIHLQSVKVKPGKPFLLATQERTHGRRRYVFGLPGNPLGSFVCMERFVLPALRQLAGAGWPQLLRSAVSLQPLPPNQADREFYQPALVTSQNASASIQCLPWKGSADIFTLAQANALLLHPALAPARPAGSAVFYLSLDA